MTVVKVFISYKYEDRAYLVRFKGMMQNPNNRFRHIFEHEKEDLRYKGRSAWKKPIRDIMKDCDVVICLVGNNTYNAQGVIYELTVAKSMGKPIIPVRIKGTYGNLPRIISDKEIIEWDSRKINEEISRLLNNS